MDDTAVFLIIKVFNSDNFSISSYLLTIYAQVTFAKNLQMIINIKMDISNSCSPRRSFKGTVKITVTVPLNFKLRDFLLNISKYSIFGLRNNNIYLLKENQQ